MTRKWGEHPNDGQGLLRVSAMLKQQCIHRAGCPKPDVCQQVGHCTSMTTAPHASDCATNNAPALPVGPCDCWLDPTPEMLQDPRFEAIWQTIKSWDINVPHAYHGYCGATGNHVRAILDALENATPGATLRGEDSVPFSAESSRPRELLQNSTEPGDDAHAKPVTAGAGATSAPEGRSPVTRAPVSSNEYLGKDRDELRQIIAERDEEIERLNGLLEKDSLRTREHNILVQENRRLNEHCCQLSTQQHEALDQVERLRAERDTALQAAQINAEQCSTKVAEIERLRAALERLRKMHEPAFKYTYKMGSNPDSAYEIASQTLSDKPPSPVETSPTLAQIREEYHRFGAFSARFVEWMGSGVETTCNCGSKDGLPLTVEATPSTGQGNTSWGSPVKASTDGDVHIHDWVYAGPKQESCYCGKTRVTVNGKGEQT